MLLAPYCYVINIISEVSLKMSGKARRVLLHTTLLLMMLTGAVNYFNDRLQELMGYESDRVRPFTTVLLIILLIALIDRKADFHALRVNKHFWTGWFVCFITIFALSFVNPVRKSYMLWCILSLTVFPMIMIVLNEREDFFAVSVIIARDMVIISYLFFAANLIITPFVTKVSGIMEYQGVCKNPNSNGLICTAFYTSALFLFIADKKDKFVYLLSMGLCIALMIISKCRTGELAVIIETCVAAVIYCGHRDLYKTDIKWRSAALALIAAILLSLSACYVLTKLDYVDLNAYAMSEYEEATEWVYSDDLRTRINDVSSGRLIIWWAYSHHLTPLGNGRLYGPLMPEDEASRWAHNNALDIGYVSGYIAMSGYILWLLAVIVFIIICIFKKERYRKEYLLGILAFIGYFIQAMLEITIYPMSNGIAFLCFMTLGAAAFCRGEEETEKHNKG